MSSKTATSKHNAGQTVAQSQVCHSSTTLLSSAWVERWLTSAVRRTHISPKSGEKTTTSLTVLDWGCGAGRHSLLAASLGCQVWALDQSVEAISAAVEGKKLPIMVLQADLEQLDDPVTPSLFGPTPLAGPFDVIVVSNYLFRSRLSLLFGLLAPGGVLVYETFAHGNADFGKPSRADFLLWPHELLDRARGAGLTVLGFEQGYVEHPKPAITQRIAAYRPE